jgi:hypothetical protein
VKMAGEMSMFMISKSALKPVVGNRVKRGAFQQWIEGGGMKGARCMSALFCMPGIAFFVWPCLLFV